MEDRCIIYLISNLKIFVNFVYNLNMQDQTFYKNLF